MRSSQAAPTPAQVVGAATASIESTSDGAAAAHAQEKPTAASAPRSPQEGVRPSEVEHSPHAQRPILCKACGERPWNGGALLYCDECEEAIRDLMREGEDVPL